MNCLACDRIKQIRDNSNPYFARELRESFVVLADSQRYEGYCILLLKSHRECLARLDKELQLRLYEDVIDVGRALNRAFSPLRINYECLGNALPHVHWHVIPRFDWDPQPESPIWVRPREERNVAVDEAHLAEIVSKLRNGLRLDKNSIKARP